MSGFSLEQLEAIIAERAASNDPDSWTARLVEAGMQRAAKKLGEESIETVIAGLAGDRQNLVAESADLLYHLLVVLRIANVPLAEILAELERRTGQSGLAEKRARAQ